MALAAGRVTRGYVRAIIDDRVLRMLRGSLGRSMGLGAVFRPLCYFEQ